MTPPEAESPGHLVAEVVTDETTRRAVFALRHEVFVLEQGVPLELEIDPNDAAAVHVAVRRRDEVVGTGRLVTEPAGFEGLEVAAGPVAHLGRIAVRADHRRRGLGAALVEALTAAAREAGLRIAYLGAQEHAVGFYQRLGWTAFGRVFDDAGLPHRHMYRTL
ncbi:MAG: GNAT family N-acetyltransferase [Actinomycetes bacterium]